MRLPTERICAAAGCQAVADWRIHADDYTAQACNGHRARFEAEAKGPKKRPISIVRIRDGTQVLDEQQLF